MTRTLALSSHQVSRAGSHQKGLIGKEVKELADKFGYSGKRDDSLEKIWLSMNYSILDNINKSEFQRFVSDAIN